MRIPSLNFWISGFILILMSALLLVLATKRQGDRLGQLAREGSIENDAPIKASLEIVIHAPPEKVWRILADVNRWPGWKTDISEAHIDGPLEGGTRFTWATGSTHIKSRIALVETNHRLSWTGSALNAHAIHIWRLERLPNQTTQIKTDESMSGFLLALFLLIE